MRHGLTVSNTKKIYAGRSDEGLSQEGIRAVRKSYQKLEGLNIERIYTSPVTRSVQTAETINKPLGVNIELRDEFTEIKMGPWKGLSEDEVSERYPKEWRTWNSTPFQLEVLGRETLEQVQARALHGINSIIQSDIHVSLVITHVTPIRVLLIHFNGINRDEYRNIDVSHGTLFRLDHSPSRVRIEQLF